MRLVPDKKNPNKNNGVAIGARNSTNKKHELIASSNASSTASSKKTTVTLAIDDSIVKELRKEAERDRS